MFSGDSVDDAFRLEHSWKWSKVKEKLASKIGICKCRVQLIIGTEVVREGLLVKRWIKRIVASLDVSWCWVEGYSSVQ